MYVSLNLTILKDQIIQTKKIFLLIHPHLHHLLIMMSVFHLPVPKNQFPIDKGNFTLIKVDAEESLEYVELPDVPLNKKLDPLMMTNLYFTAFKDPVPVLSVQVQR